MPKWAAPQSHKEGLKQSLSRRGRGAKDRKNVKILASALCRMASENTTKQQFHQPLAASKVELTSNEDRSFRARLR